VCVCVRARVYVLASRRGTKPTPTPQHKSNTQETTLTRADCQERPPALSRRPSQRLNPSQRLRPLFLYTRARARILDRSVIGFTLVSCNGSSPTSGALGCVEVRSKRLLGDRAESPPYARQASTLSSACGLTRVPSTASSISSLRYSFCTSTQNICFVCLISRSPSARHLTQTYATRKAVRL
jgi:hypothetical protein